MFSQDDRDFLREWIVDPLSKKIDGIHTPENCIKAADLEIKTKALSKDMGDIKKQIYIWCGGLAALIFFVGIFVAFMR